MSRTDYWRCTHITEVTGLVTCYEGGEWVHKTRRGTLQVRRGSWRRLAVYRHGEYLSFNSPSGYGGREAIHALAGQPDRYR